MTRYDGLMVERGACSFGVVVLAAGGSSRLGRPKQLLPYLGRTLVEHAVRTALDSGAAEVVVVVGAEALAVRQVLSGLDVRTVENSDWADGMGGSIRCGVSALGVKVDSVVIALADQPRITAAHIRALALRLEDTGKSISASSYEGVIGAPCAFAASEFDGLRSLSGDAGARSLIRGSGSVVTVEFNSAGVDVDTEDDVLTLGS